MALNLHCDCTFKAIWLLTDRRHISLHQRTDRLIHCLLAQLKRVADINLGDLSIGVLACDWLIWIQPVHFQVVFRLFEAL